MKFNQLLSLILLAAFLIVKFIPSSTNLEIESQLIKKSDKIVSEQQLAAKKDQFVVVLLGTGSPRISDRRSGPAIFVQAGTESLLFDAGRGVMLQASKARIPEAALNKVFITHLHTDHIIDLSDILMMGWIFGRSSPLYVWGPTGTKSMMGNLEEAYAYDRQIRVKDIGYKDEWSRAIATDIKEGVIYESNGVTVTAIEVDHYPIKPAYGYRVDYKGKSVVISGDTRYSPNLIKVAQGADLIIHEVAQVSERALKQNVNAGKMREHHTLPSEAGTVFSKVKPRLAVYSHIVLTDFTIEELVKETRTTYQGKLVVGEDMMAFDLINGKDFN